MRLIKHAHITFKENMESVKEDYLDWKIFNFVNSPRWIIEHIITMQDWFAKFIIDGEIGEYDESISEPITPIETLIEDFTVQIKKWEEKFNGLNEEDLTEIREYKGFSLTLEEWIYEYIYHLMHHGGQISFIVQTWKRKEREGIEN